MRYHCEAFNAHGKRIGGFEIVADDMHEALSKAAFNIEVRLRQDQHELRVSQLVEGSKPVIPSMRSEVFAAIEAERAYQEQRWEGPAHTEVTPYLTFIRHYLRKAEDLASTLNCSHILNKDKVMDQMRKIASLAVAAMEEHGVVYRRRQ